MKVETTSTEAYAYTLKLSKQGASHLRSALHIAVNLLATAEYDKLRGVMETTSGMHSDMVQMDVPLHPEVLGFEYKCHDAFKSGAFKDPEPQDRWEVQIYTADLSQWRRSVASEKMRGTSRAAAYKAMRRAEALPGTDYRVAKVGDYKHKEGMYYLEAKQKVGRPSRISFVPRMHTYRYARIAADALQKYAAPGTEVRPVFVPTGEGA